MLIFKVALLTFVVCATFADEAITEEEGVLVLTEKNFDSALQTYKFILVRFYTPWCGHCKALAPEYARAAKQLKEKNPEIKLAKVDASTEGKLAKKYGVQAYSTVKFFREQTPSNYSGGSTADTIVAWLEKKLVPQIWRLDSVDAVQKFINDKAITLIGLFKDSSSENARNYETAAAVSLQLEAIPWGLADSADVLAKFQVEQDALILFKKTDGSRIVFTGPFTTEEVAKFYWKQMLHLMREVDEALFTSLMDELKAPVEHCMLNSPVARRMALQQPPLEEVARSLTARSVEQACRLCTSRAVAEARAGRPDRARAMWLSAASFSYPPALFNLGLLAASSGSSAEAAAYYRAAADLGHPAAAFNLSVMLRQQEEEEQDGDEPLTIAADTLARQPPDASSESRRWLSRAANSGLAEALLLEAELLLDEVRLAEAEERLRRLLTSRLRRLASRTASAFATAATDRGHSAAASGPSSFFDGDPAAASDPSSFFDGDPAAASDPSSFDGDPAAAFLMPIPIPPIPPLPMMHP